MLLSGRTVVPFGNQGGRQTIVDSEIVEINSGLNPLIWKRRHRVAWAVLSLFGGVLGLAFAWVASPFSHVQQGDVTVMFAAWLHYPLAYGPYLAAGAVTAGLAYYAADFLAGAR